MRTTMAALAALAMAVVPAAAPVPVETGEMTLDVRLRTVWRIMD